MRYEHLPVPIMDPVALASLSPRGSLHPLSITEGTRTRGVNRHSCAGASLAGLVMASSVPARMVRSLPVAASRDAAAPGAVSAPDHLDADILVTEPFDVETTDAVLRGLAEERQVKAGLLIHPTRMALTASKTGPLFDVIAAMGREASVRHLRGFAASLGLTGSQLDHPLGRVLRLLAETARKAPHCLGSRWRGRSKRRRFLVEVFGRMALGVDSFGGKGFQRSFYRLASDAGGVEGLHGLDSECVPSHDSTRSVALQGALGPRRDLRRWPPILSGRHPLIRNHLGKTLDRRHDFPVASRGRWEIV